MSTLLELVQQHYDHVASGDLDAAVAAFDPDVETVTPSGTLKGVEEFRALGETFRTAMEGMRHDIVRSFEVGDTIIVESIFSGRHTGPMVTPDGTIPPSGNQVSFAYADFLQARDGKWVSHRIYWDNLTLMAQLGVAP
jgi:ketosteroid isomerase-like protein